MPSIAGFSLDPLVDTIRPRAREAQLGGVAGTLAGVLLVAGVPSFLQRYRWTLGLPLTAGSLATAYLGDQALRTPAARSKEARENRLRNAAQCTPSKMHTRAFNERERGRLKAQLTQLTKDLPGVNLTYLLEKEHRTTLDLVIRFDEWIRDIAEYTPTGLLEFVEKGPLLFKCEETVLFQVIPVTHQKAKAFVIVQPKPGTISDHSTEDGGTLMVNHQVAREHCRDRPTECTIDPNHLRNLLKAVLSKAWGKNAIVDILDRDAQWGVGVVVLEGTGLPLLGAAPPAQPVARQLELNPSPQGEV